MHDIFANLIAALLAAHSVLGCCWHHAHSGEDNCNVASAASSDSCCGDHVGHDGASKHSGHHEQRHQPCQQGKCAIADGGNLNFRGAMLQIDPPAFALVAPGANIFTADSVAVQPSYLPDAPVLPVRLHLICRVLLI